MTILVLSPILLIVLGFIIYSILKDVFVNFVVFLNEYVVIKLKYIISKISQKEGFDGKSYMPKM